MYIKRKFYCAQKRQVFPQAICIVLVYRYCLVLVAEIDKVDSIGSEMFRDCNTLFDWLTQISVCCSGSFCYIYFVHLDLVSAIERM